jgi:hypothetical protein
MSVMLFLIVNFVVVSHDVCELLGVWGLHPKEQGSILHHNTKFESQTVTVLCETKTVARLYHWYLCDLKNITPVFAQRFTRILLLLFYCPPCFQAS